MEVADARCCAVVTLPIKRWGLGEVRGPAESGGRQTLLRIGNLTLMQSLCALQHNAQWREIHSLSRERGAGVRIRQLSL